MLAEELLRPRRGAMDRSALPLAATGLAAVCDEGAAPEASSTGGVAPAELVAFVAAQGRRGESPPVEGKVECIARPATAGLCVGISSAMPKNTAKTPTKSKRRIMIDFIMMRESEGKRTARTGSFKNLLH